MTKLVTINADYIEHMMGHFTNAYTDIKDTRQLDNRSSQDWFHCAYPWNTHPTRALQCITFRVSNVVDLGQLWNFYL